MTETELTERQLKSLESDLRLVERALILIEASPHIDNIDTALAVIAIGQ